MFTTDLIASSIIFLVIVNISLLAWNTSYENRTALNQDRVVKNRVVRVTDLLIRSPGHPDDWTSSNVDIIGLAKKGKDHFLDNGKAVELKDMKYSDQRDAIRADNNDFYLKITSKGDIAEIKSLEAGIGKDPVAFIPEEGDSIGNLKLLEVLNSSSVAWDLYWPSDNSQQSLPGLTARKVYNYTEDGKAMFDDMLVNASNGEYNSVISEGSNLDTGDIQNEGQLESFVSDNGGTYVHVEEKPELIRDTFGLDEVSVGSGNGTVKETSA
ncbi:MAG: hypothetical protein SVV03_01985, partial [Candidatus Nanohaloarchaea archaeon]|nr:hypothetical protein [Candidatus Nanohaloarchaea archaeon]